MSREINSFQVVHDPDITDEQLALILDTVFVQGGYTKPAVAQESFAPAAVRARGTIIAARDRVMRAWRGLVVLVPPASEHRQIARGDEAELHLLAVHPDTRGCGIGRALVHEAIALARRRRWSQLVLSTQQSMLEAQALYAAAGFVRRPERDRFQRKCQYLAYTLSLSES